MIKVLLVDDIAILRKEMKQFLMEDEFISVVGECSDGNYVCNILKSQHVDVILMDVDMKHMGGIETTMLVRKRYPNVKVIGYSSYVDSFHKNEMLLAGASDYIVKGTSISVIKETIKSVALIGYRARKAYLEMENCYLNKQI